MVGLSRESKLRWSDMFDQNEKLVVDIFSGHFGITLEEMPETSKRPTPDARFELLEYSFLAEVKTISDTINLVPPSAYSESDVNGVSFYGNVAEDKTWSRISRLIEKSTKQFTKDISDFKVIILLNDEAASVSDLDDCLNGFIEVGEFKDSLPAGAIISRRNWKFTPDMVFWIEKDTEKVFIRFLDTVPAHIKDFFGEKLNA